MYICTYKYNAKADQEVYLHSAETYLEPFPTSKKGGYLTEGNYFSENSILDALKRV